MWIEFRHSKNNMVRTKESTIMDSHNEEELFVLLYKYNVRS